MSVGGALSMSGVLDLIIQLWPIASTLTPVILLAGFYWLKDKFPTKEQFDGLVTKVDEIETSQVEMRGNVQTLMDDRDAQPTRIELMKAMGVLAERVSAMEGGVEGIGHQLETTNDYLKILIDRGLSK